ncbi:MAG: hypothetical protein U1C73_18555 [Dietzia sp.]|nr:hypothetical protein [Dietzia sp.]
MTLQKVNVCARPGCGLAIRSRGLCNKHYEAHRSRMMAYGKWESKYVPADTARTHYAALLDAGMHRNQISRLSGIKSDQLDNLLRPRRDRGTEPAKRILRTTQERLLALAVPAPHEVWRHAADGARVDGTGTSRRLQALIAIGWTQRELSDRVGILETNFQQPLSGNRMVTAGFARTVAAVFDELQLTPGPSLRSKRRAERHGWAPPLAWDEDTIDDPAATPTIDGNDEAGVDHVAVDRGVAWVLARPVQRSPQWHAWKGKRPAMTRAERLAVAERLEGEVTEAAICGALNLRRTDLATPMAAAS